MGSLGPWGDFTLENVEEIGCALLLILISHGKRNMVS